MALKEKRATLTEAKEIRKAKQMQIENEIQLHEQRRQNHQAYLFSTKNENTSLPLNTMSQDEPPSKFIRLEDVEKDESVNGVGSRRSSVDSSFRGSVIYEQVHGLKQEKGDFGNPVSNNLKRGYNKDGLILASPSIHPPTSLFNEEDQDSLSENGPTIKEEKIKSENGDWSALDILLNSNDEGGEENKNSLELIEDKEENGSRDFSSVDDEEVDLVSECMTQSQNPFPNVDELVSGLAPLPNEANISQTMGSSKTCIYPNILIGSPSPISSQTCSSIASYVSFDRNLVI